MLYYHICPIPIFLDLLVLRTYSGRGFEEREKWSLYKRIIETIALTIGFSFKQ